MKIPSDFIFKNIAHLTSFVFWPLLELGQMFFADHTYLDKKLEDKYDNYFLEFFERGIKKGLVAEFGINLMKYDWRYF